MCQSFDITSAYAWWQPFTVCQFKCASSVGIHPQRHLKYWEWAHYILEVKVEERETSTQLLWDVAALGEWEEALYLAAETFACILSLLASLALF